MTFGEYIRYRREILGLVQQGLGGFGQAYISAIELGQKRPTNLKAIKRIARDLRLNDVQSTWLWVYSLLNEEPYSFFKKHRLHDGKHPENMQIVKEESALYMPGNNDNSRVVEGDTPADIRAKLGPPDNNLHFKNIQKWFYYDLGIQVLFEDDQVVDVVFK